MAAIKNANRRCSLSPAPLQKCKKATIAIQSIAIQDWVRGKCCNFETENNNIIGSDIVLELTSS